MHDLAIEYPEQFKKLRKTDNIASGFIRFFYLGFVIVLLAITFIPETWPNAPKIVASVGLFFVAGYFTSIFSSRNFVKNYEKPFEKFKEDLENKALTLTLDAIAKKYDTRELQMTPNNVMAFYRYNSNSVGVKIAVIPMKDKDNMVQEAIFTISKKGEISVDDRFGVSLKNAKTEGSENSVTLESDGSEDTTK